MCHRKHVLYKEATYCDVAISIFFEYEAVKLVNLDYQTLVYLLLSISGLANTAFAPTIGIGSLEWMDTLYV
jgi:hypothetical protein